MSVSCEMYRTACEDLKQFLKENKSLGYVNEVEILMSVARDLANETTERDERNWPDRGGDYWLELLHDCIDAVHEFEPARVEKFERSAAGRARRVAPQRKWSN
jgi:hypothetical protein